MAIDDAKWYFDPSTGEVTQGKQSGWENRMGPYESQEEAANALAIARKRNEDADAAEKADDAWGA